MAICFDLYETELAAALDCPPSLIFNEDETDLALVQKTQPKILAPKGTRHIGAVTAHHKGVP